MVGLPVWFARIILRLLALEGTTVPRARATPDRLSALSDGVFAVLITVLILELRPPELPTFKALLLLWPRWLSYAVSYVFIAIVWSNHHHLMRYATR
jgi:TMEM175 potassium channel family protein